MNLHTETVQNVLNYFIQDVNNATKRNNIVKRHCGDLSRSGDYSFPIEAQKWKQFLGTPSTTPLFDDISGKCIFEYAKGGGDEEEEDDEQQSINGLIRASRNWLYPLEKGMILKNRVAIYLNRGIVFRHYLTILAAPAGGNAEATAAAAAAQYGRQVRQKTTLEAIDIFGPDPSASADSKTITEYRCDQLKMVLKNLLEYSRFVVSSDADDIQTIRLKVTHKTTIPLGEHVPIAAESNAALVTIMCGTAKLTEANSIISADDYLK